MEHVAAVVLVGADLVLDAVDGELGVGDAVRVASTQLALPLGNKTEYGPDLSATVTRHSPNDAAVVGRRRLLLVLRNILVSNNDLLPGTLAVEDLERSETRAVGDKGRADTGRRELVLLETRVDGLLDGLSDSVSGHYCLLSRD